jgi:hypothetical protein
MVPYIRIPLDSTKNYVGGERMSATNRTEDSHESRFIPVHSPDFLGETFFLGNVHHRFGFVPTFLISFNISVNKTDYYYPLYLLAPLTYSPAALSVE